MKAFDFEAVVYDGAEYCVECLPKGVSVNDEDVSPIFADESRERPAICNECAAEHDYMPLPPKLPFFLFEMREGDDNDVSVSEFFVRAENEDAAWSTIETIVRAKIGDRIWADDGDTDYWSVQFRAKNHCKVIEDCGGECGADHRDFFATFTFLKELDEEPMRSMSMFHSWEGEWTFDAAEAALDKFLATIHDGRQRARIFLETPPMGAIDFRKIFDLRGAKIVTNDVGQYRIEKDGARVDGIYGDGLDFLRFLQSEDA
jgi:hypothetical protein